MGAFALVVYLLKAGTKMLRVWTSGPMNMAWWTWATFLLHVALPQLTVRPLLAASRGRDGANVLFAAAFQLYSSIRV